MIKYLIVGTGGVLGALSRYWLGGLFKIPAGGFPIGTFIINLTGSFVLGLFLTLIIESFKVRDEWRLFFATGFVGAYTTFSSFTNEVANLLRQGDLAVALLYSVGSLVGGLVCVIAGFALAREIAFRRVIPQKLEAARLQEQEVLDKQRDQHLGVGKTGILPAEERSELEPD